MYDVTTGKWPILVCGDLEIRLEFEHNGLDERNNSSEGSHAGINNILHDMWTHPPHCTNGFITHWKHPLHYRDSHHFMYRYAHMVVCTEMLHVVDTPTTLWTHPHM